MQHIYNFSAGGPISEMAIVDTFTKLIFGEEEDYSQSELEVIAALRAVDAHIAADDLGEMGNYLGAQGVAEMIELVAKVRTQLLSEIAAVAGASAIADLATVHPLRRL